MWSEGSAGERGRSTGSGGPEMPEERGHWSLEAFHDANYKGEPALLVQEFLEQLRERGVPQPASSQEWELFIKLNSDFLLRLVRRRSGLKRDIDDEVQEVLLMLVEELPHFRYDPGRGQALGWIAAAVQNLLVDQYRYRRSHPAQQLDAATADRLAGREPDPAAALEQQLVVKSVRAALVELRPHVKQRDYDAFMLHWVDELPVREVAVRLDMTEGEVWASHHRTREKFRPLLARRLNGVSEIEREFS